jgi:hypothetical protein
LLGQKRALTEGEAHQTSCQELVEDVDNKNKAARNSPALIGLAGKAARLDKLAICLV